MMNDRVRAPRLDAGLGWLNTDRPLSFDGDLNGRVVLLDFWTYCCINCIHIFPDLAYLEEKYKNEPFVVIGVHSAKFANEANSQTIRAAIQRYEMHHPVVIDDQMRIWQSYGVRSWPTVMVVDPEGYVVGAAPGEGNRDALDKVVADLLAEHRKKGTLADGPPEFRMDAVVRPATGLAFPGKVFADEATGRVFIADSNHNRIVVTDWPDEAGRCKLIQSIGTGKVGMDDGPADAATFDHPQGVTLMRDKVYVADTENHGIREINTKTWEVRTAVGTGKMTYDHAGGGMGTGQGINSPWDLVCEGATLYVAMAGQHQLWRIDMPVGFARGFAGSGRENLVDGPTEHSALAQPSGICFHRGRLYFADSEVSAIRYVDMATEQVHTLIGEGLFVFGDKDGPVADARLQHPLGVAAWREFVLVADTYNHKIKKLDPIAGTIETIYGTGQPGASEGGAVAFFDPGGLHVAGDTLFVADTNNHRIVMIDLTTHEWREMLIEGLGVPYDDDSTDDKTIDAGSVNIADDRPVELALTVELPGNAHLNIEAPWNVRVESESGAITQQTGQSDAFPILVSIPTDAPGGKWRVALSFAYCTEGAESLCIPGQLNWRINTSRDSAGGDKMDLKARTEELVKA
jgi:thiol-disulfide isomerase/thioredoxin